MSVTQPSNKKRVATSVFNYMRQQTERLLSLNRIRSSDMLKTTLNRFMDFRGGSDCSFALFDADLMERFEAYLKNRGLKRNTIGFYMRTLRTSYNNAVEQGMTPDQNPFRRVYTGKDKTQKRALKAKDVRTLIELDLASRPNLDFARDMFLLSFMARGMSFVDMAYLRKTDMQGNHFTYCRRKTGQQLTVEWIPEMQDILSKYAPNPTQYFLPIIVRTDKPDRRQYLNQAENINHALKEVARLANIQGRLSMYYARHTWGTLARDRNVPLAVISEALGHDSEKTTQIYLDSIQTTVVDQANRQLVRDLIMP